MVAVGVGVMISVEIGVSVGVGVKVGVLVGVGVAVGFGVDVGVGLGVDVGFGVGVDVGIKIGFGVGVDIGINIGLVVGVGLIIGQVQLGLYVPSQQTCLPTFVSQPQTPPCQEQQPCLAKIGEGNKKMAINKIAGRKTKQNLSLSIYPACQTNYNI